MTLSDRILSALGRGPKTFPKLIESFDGIRKQSVSTVLNRMLKAKRITHNGATPRVWSLPEAQP